MRNIHSINGYVVCQRVNPSAETLTSGKFIYQEENVPLYKVMHVADDVPNDPKIIPGDIIIVNSTGTGVILDESKVYLFKHDNIIGKIL